MPGLLVRGDLLATRAVEENEGLSFIMVALVFFRGTSALCLVVQCWRRV